MTEKGPTITTPELVEFKMGLTDALEMGTPMLHVATDRYHALAGLGPNLATITDPDNLSVRPISIISAVLVFKGEDGDLILPIVSLRSQ